MPAGDNRWQEAATNERLDTCFYLDSRPEFGNYKGIYQENTDYITLYALGDTTDRSGLVTSSGRSANRFGNFPGSLAERID